MFYERKIKYLDEQAAGQKCGNVGYAKLEARGDFCNITIDISKLRENDSLVGKVVIIGNEQERELCSLEIVRGKGKVLLERQELRNIGGTGIAYQELEAIKILLSAGREIYGVIGQAKQNEMIWEQREGPVAEEIIPVPDTDEELAAEAEKKKEEEEREEEKEEEKELTEVCATERRVPLCEDKWEQLWAIYPHISPFHDGREYLSVGPSDFVILPGRYFRAVNNSFLLHGYYNYKHLILKKMEYRGEARYYIGVPGNFYDREKQVAVMFGFESFESMEEPAEAGDYGYYMMRVEL